MGCCLTKQTKHKKYANAGCDEHPIQQPEESNYFEVCHEPVVPKEVKPEAQEKQEKQEQEKQITWTEGEMIGQGAFGRVVLGMNRVSGQIMAVKQVFIKNGDENKVQSIQREIEILSQLQHPHIVRYYGSETKNDQLNIFLEYVSGGSVLTMIKRFGEIQGVFNQRLHFLHSKGVIHRDIKGANILINQNGQVKLADFGSGKQLSEIKHDIVGSLCGTPNYMAPEIIELVTLWKVSSIYQVLNRKADIWSLGCTMIEMATGHPPFSEVKNIYTVMVKISKLTETFPIPEELKSEQARDFLKRCLQLNPEDRWEAEDLLQHPFLISKEQRYSGLNSAQEKKNVFISDDLLFQLKSELIPNKNKKLQFSFQLDDESQSQNDNQHQEQEVPQYQEQQGQGSQREEPITNIIKINNNNNLQSEPDQDAYKVIIEQNFDDRLGLQQFDSNLNCQKNKKLIINRQCSLNQALDQVLNDAFQPQQSKSLNPLKN
ncbi:unnamed protein product (macronuclear) [Paramecium tetraurelia]|uniref:Protein kinase domain-containing protein n=1 Tax=Paramecium tetraurelia TaxID=5888 RepID=A0BG19_PARTE|nr:uncharacterized protein GSPATT00028521001 [Paramecium tetraurelia]CAK57486.1 unnamed protein product [Paramecium tetraurelia]|eukprot:XP_001424884.1 hypothetical protein (macronuclear) [Paramecium tetraurelia strain d4-2]